MERHTRTRTFTKAAIAALSVFCGISFAQTSKIAIYVSEHSMEREVLEMTTLNALVNSGRYEVVERSGVIDEELNRQASGAVDDDQLTRFGRQAGAQYICVSDMASPFGTRYVERREAYYVDIGNKREVRYRTERDPYVDYQVSARIIDVETAEIVALGVVTKSNIGKSVTGAANSAVGEMLKTVQDKTDPNMSKIAVYVQGSSDWRVRNAVYTYVLNALFTRSRYNGDFKVVERSEAFTRQIDREMGKQTSGAVDNAQISRMGKQYGIEKILIANVAASGSNAYKISSRLINVETASVVKASANIYDYSGEKDMELLRRVSVQVVEDMIPRKITEAEIEEEKRIAEAEAERDRQIKAESEEIARTAWWAGFAIGGGVSLNMNEIDPNYFTSLGGQFNMSAEFYKQHIKFLRFGVNLDIGGLGVDRDAVRRLQPNVLIDDIHTMNLKANAFLKLHPANFLFVSGGAGLGYYRIYSKGTKPGSVETDNVDVVSISTPVFPVGGGIVLGPGGNGVVIEGYYNIVPFQGRTASYISINAGFKGNIRITEEKKYEKKQHVREMI